MTWLRFLLLGLLTAVLFILNIFFGAVHIDASVVLDILTGYGIDDDPLNFIILESRLPQAITALLAGAALGVSRSLGTRNQFGSESRCRVGNTVYGRADSHSRL